MDKCIKSSPCKECDVVDDGQLGAEVEHLRQHLAERDSHIVALEAEFVKTTSRVKDLDEQLHTWREKYERLNDSHKRVQKLNQVLEDKLLQMVDKMKGEKSQLTKDIATLSVRLAESKHNFSMLQKENERYKNDMNLAIQLLQCKPDNFVSQKLDNLPVDTQTRVSQYVMSKTSKPSSSTQSRNGNELDTFDASEYEFNISASLMSKILEDSIQDTVTKHCDTCICMKSQSKPFCYNESYYSVATQTFLSGDMKNSLCLNCNSEIKSVHSNLSLRSASPHAIKLVNEKLVCPSAPGPYIVPQPVGEQLKVTPIINEASNTSYINNETSKPVDKVQLLPNDEKNIPPIDASDLKQLRKNTMNMEPAVHHKLCDRTRTSISSKKSSVHSVGNEELMKELSNSKDITKDIKPINENSSLENYNVRKNSLGSMGAVSRTSSVAKSTVSTHKSNTQVGPGPRFCHLRMQAGSKNILLDNAQPDVPPVLYRRQSKCNENSIFKDLNDGMENFMDIDRTPDEKEDAKNDNIVVESTLIDVHVDNNAKECNTSVKSPTINPVLLNVSSSPLQPLKTHTFSNSSENNNNKSQSVDSQQNVSETDNILNEFNADMKNMQNNNIDGINTNDNGNKLDVLLPTESQDVKIFNFDRYEQNKLSNLHTRPLRKIDLSQLHSIESTRISKDFRPLDNHQHQVPQYEKKTEHIPPKSVLPAVVNVYPNLTQTHLKVNETTKVFTNEQSTSSLSSDDSAALLQKQQLLRVAEWVEKNLEQQNNLNDPLEDDVAYSNNVMRRDSKLSRLSETLNELALNMPHPVSKYSKSFTRDGLNNWVRNSIAHNDNVEKKHARIPKANIGKETSFPVESGDATITETNDNSKARRNASDFDVGKELRNALKSNDKEITAEELARMEYNVKKFLLSGPHWTNETTGRSRRTSSKTETDV
ncbi:uncharacterized protein MAL13P1.304 isoform X1 [Cydia pomonella]|uniref:uncharacterized protein MAL13P1.304 isoform X1 n=2 Tax=Cydia pomonella TaxID=82600 RepID=UPI002ADDA8A4|nr:uncharacterized protein MAL13P1.304 isoform X1 [Cydia pomonella]